MPHCSALVAWDRDRTRGDGPTCAARRGGRPADGDGEGGGRLRGGGGGTGRGKAALGVARAKALRGEVLNADSMQLYGGMDIGAAKLTAAEQEGVPHHLLDIWPVTRTASVADYQRLARDRIANLLARGVTPVLVGGSGLYVRAVLDRMEFPGTDPALRAALEQELATVGPAPLHARLAASDPAAAARSCRRTAGGSCAHSRSSRSPAVRSPRPCRRTSR